MRCYFAQYDSKPCSFRDDGRPDRAHLIPKQRMRITNLPDGVVWDSRVWVPACRAHHHRFDMRFFNLKRDQLPPAIEDFAAEHRLVWSLRRDYGE